MRDAAPPQAKYNVVAGELKAAQADVSAAARCTESIVGFVLTNVSGGKSERSGEGGDSGAWLFASEPGDYHRQEMPGAAVAGELISSWLWR